MKAELVLGNLKRERDALDNKLERLETALGKEWQDADQEYLCTQQYNAMCLYAHILDERIADIEYKLDQKKNKACQSHETCHNENNIFKKKIDLGSCKVDVDNSQINDIYNEYNCIDSKESILDMLKSIFGIEIIE